MCSHFTQEFGLELSCKFLTLSETHNQMAKKEKNYPNHQKQLSETPGTKSHKMLDFLVDNIEFVLLNQNTTLT